LASNFSNDPPQNGTPDPAVEVSATTEQAIQESPGLVRFKTCRWQQPAEAGMSEFCTHREVKPYAGTTGFDADAWCTECQYFKLRRTPKKRERDEYSY
jgi:post-segregation antitoxin (ccd killing protein)